LLRQIHPGFVQEGRVSSQAFRPTPKDQQQLSVYDGDLIAPEPAYTHYTATLGLRSTGVMGVQVVECRALELPVTPDTAPFPEHVLIDFTAFSKAAVEKKAKQLRSKAEQRGWLYRGMSA